MQSPTALFFFDGKFQFIEDSVQEGNAGLREMTPSGWNLGAWLSGDVRETSADNTFWQVAGGLEALSVKWDLRLNGYLPVTDPQLSPSTAEVVLQRNNIFMIGGEEVALYGVDGEIGYLLFGSPETKPGTRHELRVYGGGFWFDHSDAIHEVAGPSARIEWRIDNLIPDWGGSRLTFDAGYSHDEVRDDRWQAGARARRPHDLCLAQPAGAPHARADRARRRHRHRAIGAGESVRHSDRRALRQGGLCQSSITDVSAKAGDNSLLIVNGTVSGPQELQGNQTLQGGKSTIQVTGLKSGVTTNFTAPGAKATLNNPGDAANLTLLGSNTHVAGLTIEGGGAGNFANFGIFGGSNKNNVVIEQTRIGDTGHAGILFDSNNSNVTIFDTRVTDAGQEGIVFDDNNSAISFSGTAIANAGFNGISFGDGNQDVTIADTTITNTSNEGIFFADGNSNVTISRHARHRCGQ